MTSPAIPSETHLRDGYLAGEGVAKETSPAFSQCYLIQHDNGWTIWTPLEFISLEDLCK